MFSTADCSSFDRCIAVATNKKTKSFECATYMKPLALWECGAANGTRAGNFEGDSHARWTDSQTLTHVVKIKVFLKRELPGKRNVLVPASPAAKRDVWITARPHEPVLAK